jgi:hypothetical protein
MKQKYYYPAFLCNPKLTAALIFVSFRRRHFF